jgi:hypothetical protein
MTNPIKDERCYFCNQIAEYSQVVKLKDAFFMSVVCKKHLDMGLVS